MVSANSKWLLQVFTNSVQFLVPVLRVELMSLHHVWLVLTDLSEHIFVQVKGALIDARSALPLAAHAEDWFELLKPLHCKADYLKNLLIALDLNERKNLKTCNKCQPDCFYFV